MDRPLRRREIGLPEALLWAALALAPGAAAPRVLELVQEQIDVSFPEARSLALSADGRHLYVGGLYTTIVERDPATGELAFAGGTRGADLVAVSPDGRHVYMYDHGPLRVLARDPETGATSLVEAWGEGMSGIHRFSPSAMALSPDGRHLYVTTLHASLLVFARDPGTGVLSHLATHLDGVDGVAGLDGARHLAASPDGSRLYVASRPFFGGRDALAVFARDAARGSLSFAGALYGGPQGVEALAGAHQVRVSPDGRHLYVAGDGRVAAFARDDGAGLPGLVGVTDVDAESLAASPDGRFLYAVGDRESGVVALARDPASGRLEIAGAFSQGLAGLGRAAAVAVTRDGRHLYAAGPEGAGWVAAFTRDAARGALGLVAVYVRKVEGAVDGLFGVEAAAVSPDGRHLYAVNSRGVSALRRSAATGELEFLAFYHEPDGYYGLEGAGSVALGPDGRQVYVASSGPDHALVVLARDAATGELDPLEIHRDGVGGVDGLDYARGVAVSPDGRNVYVASSGDHAVAVFARREATGTLDFLEAHVDGEAGVDGLAAAHAVAVSPDGSHVYVFSYGDDAVAVFARRPASGRLAFVEAHFDGLAGVEIGGAPGRLAVSPDGGNVYVASGAAVAAFARDATSGRLGFLAAEAGHARGVRDVAVSPEGDVVYAFGQELVVYPRQAATGALGPPLEARSFPRYDSYWGHAGTLSPDGRHLYVVTSFGLADGILVLRRDDGPCRPAPGALCLRRNRFRVEVDWRDFAGGAGSARGVPYGADESGLFWFFSPANWEMQVKVLDGCSINDRFWVFAAATTDVSYTLRVTDVRTGAARTYFSPLGAAAPAITDTDAFATCGAPEARRSPRLVEKAAPPADPAVRPAADGAAGSAPGPEAGDEIENRHLLIGFGGKCLDVEGAAAVDGTPVNLYDCHRRANQRWRFEDDCGYGGCSEDFEIRGLGGACLQPRGGAGASHTPLVLGPCGGPEDRWESRGLFPERLSLFHVASGRCADVEGGGTANGTPVNLFDCHGGANQRWDYRAIRCVASPVNRCLNRDRFQVEVEWWDFAGATGRGRVVPYGSPDSGLYWFFTPENWEMLVKVLDGCAINGRYWVYAAATTDVELTLRVTDVETGRVREYFNPLGRAAAPVTDTSAFAGCP